MDCRNQVSIAGGLHNESLGELLNYLSVLDCSNRSVTSRIQREWRNYYGRVLTEQEIFSCLLTTLLAAY